MVLYGQLVIGPPGAGKTTYCYGMSMFLCEIDRNCDIVNLDFANENLPYKATIDVRDLILLETAMTDAVLGPNGGLIYCMEYLLEHLDWLIDRLQGLNSSYVLFDCPGQVELFTHYNYMEILLRRLQDELDARICSIHLVDSYLCTQPSTFISAILLIASTMLRLALPHVNVLSKVDLLSRYGPLPFNFDFFTELADLSPLIRYIDAPFLNEEELQAADVEAVRETDIIDDDDGSVQISNSQLLPPPLSLSSSSILASTNAKRRQFNKMNEALCDMLSDFSLVSFLPLSINDAETVGRVLAQIDKANGYSFAAAEIRARREASVALGKFGTTTDGLPQSGSESQASLLFRMASQDTELSYFRSIEIMEKYSTPASMSANVKATRNG